MTTDIREDIKAVKAEIDNLKSQYKTIRSEMESLGYDTHREEIKRMNKMKPFHLLKIGDCFKDSNLLCIVVPKYNVSQTYNDAICLKSGKIYPIHPDTEVYPVKAIRSKSSFIYTDDDDIEIS